MNRPPSKPTIPAKVVAYETTAPLFAAMFLQIRELAKKKPDGTLNSNKVKLINRLLADIQGFLVDEPGYKYLDLLSDEDLPQYSDVLLIMSQYSAALKEYRAAYFYIDNWYTT